MATSTSNLTNLVLRPNTGTLGRPIQVRTNFFRVQSLPTQNIYHYDVDVEPFLPQTKLRALWLLFEDAHPDVVGNSKAIFDGRKNVFSIARFALGQVQAQAFPVSRKKHVYFFFCINYLDYLSRWMSLITLISVVLPKKISLTSNSSWPIQSTCKN